MVFKDKLILLLKNIELNLMNDIYGRAHCPWVTAYNALFCAVHEPKYALPLQGGGSLLYVTQGDGALRLCPGLLCYAPSGRLNACLRQRFICICIPRYPMFDMLKMYKFQGRDLSRPVYFIERRRDACYPMSRRRGRQRSHGCLAYRI